MKVKCKVCRRDVEINELDYQPGDKVTVECERCGNEVEVTIPQRDEQPKETQPKIIKEAVSEQPSKGTTTESASEVSEEDNYVTVSQGRQEPEISLRQEAKEEPSSYAIPPVVNAKSVGVQVEPDKKGKGWLVIMVMLLLAVGAGGWWYYDNIYLPEKIDREAARTYPIVNINLRSSKMAGSDYNKLTSVPYGGELITYNQDEEWADVKYVKPDGSESTKGYAASPYLVDKKDFFMLNSIFGDNESREILATAKVRRALLEYYKQNGYVGALSPEMMEEVGLAANSDNQWQVFFPHGDKKPNEVVFKRIVNPDSKFTDMALIIKNINTGDRKLLYFYFDDDETPHFFGEMAAPSDVTLKDIVNQNGEITPIFAY